MTTFDDDCKAAIASLIAAPAVTIELPALEAWVLLGMLQLALRHPRTMHCHSGAIAREAGRKIQAAVAPDGTLGRLAEMGWDPAYDDFEGMNG